METVSETRCFGGVQKTIRHASKETGTDMNVSVFLPPAAENGPVPVLYYLSGLTCTEENVTVKGGATETVQANLAKKGAVGPKKPGEPGNTSRLLFYGTAGVAATGAVIATITGLQVRGSLKTAKEDAIRDWQNATGMQLVGTGGDACSQATGVVLETALAAEIVSACDAGNSRAPSI